MKHSGGIPKPSRNGNQWPALSLVCGITLTTAFAAAADPAMVRSGDQPGWSVDGTWWVFAPVSTTGTSTIDGQSASIDMDLSEALEVLDFTSSLRFEAWQGDFGLLLDGNYLSLSEDGAATIGGGPFARDLAAEVKAEQSWVSLMAGYRFVKGATENGATYAADIHGGVRYNRIHQELEIDGTARSQTLGGTETWWEPVIGARGAYQVNQNWFLSGGIDLAGFGAGGNDLAWSATAAFDRRISERLSLKVGYRYYSIDFETDQSGGAFGWDIEQHGPFFGLTYSFQ